MWWSACSALVVLTTLAGCSGDAPPGDGPIRIEEGRGAIAGLLVDDRFRPIHLTADEPTTEFQARGFVLLQETGEQVLTSQNGEFSFSDLTPDTYTLRVAAGGHEAVPQKVTVQAGSFAETSIVARRVISAAGAILTQENSMFIACAADFIVNGGNLPCDLDFSSDAYSSAFTTNYTHLGEASAMITELKTNQEKRYEIQVRGFNETAGSTDRYAVAIFEGDYHRITNVRGEINLDDQDNPGYPENVAWDNRWDFDTIMFVDHDGREELQSLGSPTCCGVGASLGIKATFLQSVFLGAPEVELASYCALC
jgi:hypothetical protein